MSSKSVKFVQVSGMKALQRLREGGIARTKDGKSIWKIIDGQLHYRCPVEGFTLCLDQLNTFLNPLDDDWFIEETPFDPRQEMLEQPNEWIAKYTTFGKWYYIGFDFDEMVAIQSDSLKNEVDYNDDNVDLVHSYGIKNAIPLDKEDLNFLAAYKNK